MNPHALCRTQDFKSCASTNSATPAISMTNAECGILKSHLIIHIPQFIEAPSGFEPLHKGFADLSVTTWVRRQFLSIFQLRSGILLQLAKSHSRIKTPLPGGLCGSGASSLRRFLSFSIRHLGEMMPSSQDESVPDSVASQRQSGKRGSDPRPQPWQESPENKFGLFLSKLKCSIRPTESNSLCLVTFWTHSHKLFFYVFYSIVEQSHYSHSTSNINHQITIIKTSLHNLSCYQHAFGLP